MKAKTFFPCLFLGLLFTFAIQAHSIVEESNEVPHSNSEEPKANVNYSPADFDWIDNIIEELSDDCDCLISISQVFYEGTAFYFESDDNCLDSSDLIYDIDGNIICAAGGLSGPDIPACGEFVMGDLLWECSEVLTEINMKVLLEGPYIGDGQMASDLNTLGLLPTEQPFDIWPYNYTSNVFVSNLPEDAVDWVLVEAREALDASDVTSQVAWVMADGSLRRISGSNTNPPSMILDNTKTYFFWIRHRNHLDVVTAQPYSPSNFSFINLTTDVTLVYGNEQLKATDDGYVVMYSGDTNRDGVINVSDYDDWAMEPAVVNQLRPTDMNMDGSVQVTDYDEWFPNRAKVGAAQLEIE